ncbi:MAG: hypothetical protein B7X60_16475, partial [Polynucleobacter sp. 39-45-136]
MLIEFFLSLKEAKIPVSVREFLSLLDALKAGVIEPSIDEFYQLARMTLVKDEQYFDRYDQVFGVYFQGIEKIIALAPDIPADWLEKKLQRVLSAEEKAALQKLGGPQALQKRLQELMKEQKEWHGGGKKWIGAGGSSPFGHSGYHPEGIRIGGESAGNRTAIKVWEAREFKDYDSDLSLGTRNIKMALRRLRRF